MKIKSLAILVMTGCLATVAYIAPAMADDANGAQSMQVPVDNVGSVNTNQDTDAMSNNSSPSDANASPNNANDAPGNDQASPDTATGDDDY